MIKMKIKYLKVLAPEEPSNWFHRISLCNILISIHMGLLDKNQVLCTHKKQPPGFLLNKENTKYKTRSLSFI
jgi:hypothetical protein